MGADALHKIEQGRGAGIDWLGRTIEAAMHVDTDVALCRDIGDRRVDRGARAHDLVGGLGAEVDAQHGEVGRSEEHTSELQSLMRISYAVFCLKKKKMISQSDVYTLDKYNIHKHIYTKP